MAIMIQFSFDSCFNFVVSTVYNRRQSFSLFCRGLSKFCRFIGILLCNLVVLLLFQFSVFFVFFCNCFCEVVYLVSSTDDAFFYFMVNFIFSFHCVNNILFRFKKNSIMYLCIPSTCHFLFHYIAATAKLLNFARSLCI